jgi:hypothetical protein
MTIYFWRFETPDLTPEIDMSFLYRPSLERYLRERKRILFLESIFDNF